MGYPPTIECLNTKNYKQLQLLGCLTVLASVITHWLVSIYRHKYVLGWGHAQMDTDAHNHY